LGLLGVLEARREEMMMMITKKSSGNLPLPPPLLVVGPHSVGRWLAEAAAAAGWSDQTSNLSPPSLPLDLLYRFASASSLYQRHDPEGARKELEQLLNLEAWVPVRADHCSDAHGAVLWSKRLKSSFSSSNFSSQSPCSWSLAVSGDTVPTDHFARAARGVDLLVHEATFASTPQGQEHASRKKHSTISGALGVSAASFAGLTVLTHFSQRYPGLPPEALEASGQWDAAGAVAAADGMRVRWSQLGRLRGLTGRTVDAIGGAEEEEGEDDEGEEDGKGKASPGDFDDDENGEDACGCEEVV